MKIFGLLKDVKLAEIVLLDSKIEKSKSIALILSGC